jgi:hypothetical protein
MKKIIILIILLLGAVGTWAWQNDWFLKIPLLNGTSDWETYVSEEHEFEIKYPRDMLVKDLGDSDYAVARLSICGGEYSEFCGIMGAAPHSEIYLFKFNKDGAKKFPSDSWLENEEIDPETQITSINIDGKQGKLFKGGDLLSASWEADDQFFYQMDVGDLDEFPNLEETFRGILYSFESKENDELTREKIKNAEIEIPGEKILFINGEYFNKYLHVTIDDILFEDVDNDGKKEAILINLWNHGGSGTWRKLMVLKNENGKPVFFAEKDLGGGTVINSLTIDSGEMIIDMTVHGPDDPNCCPSIREQKSYKLSDNSIVEIENSTWLVYENDKFGFEMKYPDNWIFNSDISENGGLFYISKFPPIDVYPSGESSEGIPQEAMIILIDADEYSSKEDFCARMNEIASYKCETKIMVGDAEGYKTESFGAYEIVLYKNGKIFVINNFQNSIFEKILSTFKFLPSPLGINISSDCKIVGRKGDIDHTEQIILGENEWLIDCGSYNNNARGIFGDILESSGWQFCESSLAASRWWKDGIITGIVESAGVSYPFRIIQSQGPNCASDNSD